MKEEAIYTPYEQPSSKLFEKKIEENFEENKDIEE